MVAQPGFTHNPYFHCGLPPSIHAKNETHKTRLSELDLIFQNKIVINKISVMAHGPVNHSIYCYIKHITCLCS